MEFIMSIRTKVAALALAALAVTGTIATTTMQAQVKPIGSGNRHSRRARMRRAPHR
jgi:hypothetical protein